MKKSTQLEWDISSLETDLKSSIIEFEQLKQEAEIVLQDPLLGRRVLERLADKLKTFYEYHSDLKNLDLTIKEKKEEQIELIGRNNKQILIFLTDIKIKLIEKFIYKSRERCEKMFLDFDYSYQLQDEIDGLMLLGFCSERMKEETRILENKAELKDSHKYRLKQEIKNSKEMDKTLLETFLLKYRQARKQLKDYCEEQLNCFINMFKNRNELEGSDSSIDSKNSTEQNIPIEKTNTFFQRNTSLLRGFLFSGSGAILGIGLLFISGLGGFAGLSLMVTVLITAALGALMGVAVAVGWHIIQDCVLNDCSPSSDSITDRNNPTTFLYRNQHVGVGNKKKQDILGSGSHNLPSKKIEIKGSPVVDRNNSSHPIFVNQNRYTNNQKI